MSNCPLSVDVSMLMGIFLDLIRKELRKKLSMRRVNNGIKFKNLIQQSKETKIRGKEEKWGWVAIYLGINRKKTEQL